MKKSEEEDPDGGATPERARVAPGMSVAATPVSSKKGKDEICKRLKRGTQLYLDGAPTQVL